MPTPVDVFFSYSHVDEDLREQLASHLAFLRHQGVIRGWHDHQIAPGQDWKAAIDEHLEQAGIILLLVSSDFLASTYCYDMEMKRALERHAARQATVIPIILRACNWSGAPFAKLQALPKGGKPVKSWPDRDEAWTEVAAGIRDAAAKLYEPLAPPEASSAPVVSKPTPRHADASAQGTEVAQKNEQWKGGAPTAEVDRRSLAPRPKRRGGGHLGEPFQAPSLPSHFVPRRGPAASLKERLLSPTPDEPGVLVVGAIHGLGGIGKSFLAAAITYDPDVQDRFADGILWVTLGQRPQDILPLLSGWIQALGDYEFRPTTCQAATGHLRTLLRDQAVLLVVDDAWTTEDVKHFLAGGSRCRALVTSRRANVAAELGAAPFALDVMTQEEAVELIARRLGRPILDDERIEAMCLAEEVGYLPLALELLAARISRGFSWAALRVVLAREAKRIEAVEGPRARRAQARLKACFNASLNAVREDSEATWRAFVWLGVLPEDVKLTVTMACTLWDVDEQRASDMIEILCDESLLFRVSGESAATWRFHDLLHEMARHLLDADAPEGLGFTESYAHAALLDRYTRKAPGGNLCALPNDGYVFDRLTWHMERAGRSDDLHALLRRETADRQSAWYEARDRLGQTAGYLEDVMRAWRLARDPASNDGSGVVIGLQCRYALIVASVHSLAATIAPEAIDALVANGLWAPEKALTYARRMTDIRKRRMLVILASRLDRMGDEAGALEVASEIDLPEERIRALHEMAARSTSRNRVDTLARAIFAAIQSIADPAARFSVISELLASRTVGGILDVFECELRDRALISATTIQDPRERSSALGTLAAFLEGPARETVVSDALELIEATRRSEHSHATRQVEGTPWWCESAPREGVPFAPPSSRGITGLALAGEEERWRHNAAERDLETLVKLIPLLPEALKERAKRSALDAALGLRALEVRTRLLRRFAAHLRPESASEVWDRIVETLGEVGFVPDIELFERNLWSELPNSHHDTFFESMMAWFDGFDASETSADDWSLRTRLDGALRFVRSRAARDLRERFRKRLLHEVRKHATQIKDPERRTNFLTHWEADLAETPDWDEWSTLFEEQRAHFTDLSRPAQSERAFPPLTLEERGRLLAAVPEGIRDNEERIRVGLSLVPYLPEDRCAEMLDLVRRIRDEWQRMDAFAQLLAFLPENWREMVAEEALEAALCLESEWWRIEALFQLLPYINDKQLQRACAAAQLIKTADLQTKALVGFALRFADRGNRGDAIDAVRSIALDTARAQGMVTLAVRLADLGHLEEAIRLARIVTPQDIRGRGLAEIALRLALNGQGRAAQQMAEREIEDERFRSWTLGRLASLSVPSVAAHAQSTGVEAAVTGPRDEGGSVLEEAALARRDAAAIAFSIARAKSSSFERSAAFAALAEEYALMPRAHVAYLWDQEVDGLTLLQALALHPRGELLEDLRALMPLIGSLGGATAAGEIFDAIKDVGQFWP